MSYSLVFSGKYSLEVIQDSDIPDKENPRFYPVCKNMCTVLSQSFINNPSIPEASGNIVFNKNNYKITLLKAM
jgi:hypothetical protein